MSDAKTENYHLMLGDCLERMKNELIYAHLTAEQRREVYSKFLSVRRQRGIIDAVPELPDLFE